MKKYLMLSMMSWMKSLYLATDPNMPNGIAKYRIKAMKG